MCECVVCECVLYAVCECVLFAVCCVQCVQCVLYTCVLYAVWSVLCGLWCVEGVSFLPLKIARKDCWIRGLESQGTIEPCCLPVQLRSVAQERHRSSEQL